MREHTIIKRGGKKYLACNECWEVKELTSDFWVKDNKSKHWFVYKCKECLRKRHKIAQHKYNMSHKEEKHLYNITYNKEHREEIREKRRIGREKEKEKRKLRMKEVSKKTHAHNKLMGYSPTHQRVSRIIKKLWIRPKSCSICWFEWLVVAHHPDYSKWNEIVFCCNSCHRLIHSWEIDVAWKIIKICDSLWERELIYCDYCWTPMQNDWRRHCKECNKLAHRDAQRRHKEKLLYSKQNRWELNTLNADSVARP